MNARKNAPAPGEERVRYEDVAVSTRVRLARNFANHPFPNRLSDEKTAREIVRLIASDLNGVDSFQLYYMNAISDETAAFLKERYLISQDLINNRRISAALISRDESISVMINEEDHVREQYFMKGFDLHKAYERISGIDDIISESLPFAYDRELGYLTACPTNLGTGLRASVMLFLPALARRERMRKIAPAFKQLGLAVRGAFGEGSGAEGDLFQISNEITLGIAEEEILSTVSRAVTYLVKEEIKERLRMKAEERLTLCDRILRAYGALTHCLKIDAREFMQHMADVKLGVALDLFEGNLEELDDLIIALRPANINRLNGAPLSREEQDIYRAEYAEKALRSMELYHESKRNQFTFGG